MEYFHENFISGYIQSYCCHSLMKIFDPWFGKKVQKILRSTQLIYFAAIGIRNFRNGPKWWALKQPQLLSHFSWSYRAPAFIISPPPAHTTAVAQCLRCCATNLKVAGSIPDGVSGIFHWHNPFDRTMALESTQPLTEMSTRSISWG